MAIPTVLTDLSATLASNSPAGGDAAFPNIDDYLRAAYGFIRQGDTKASDVASASSTDLGAAVGRIVDVTGVTTITSFGTVAAGIWRIVRFTGALTLTHNATTLILPGAANITTAAGDCLVAVSLGSGNWLVPFYQNASVVPYETVSGTYTPTGYVGTNTTVVTPYQSIYTRVGSVVTVTGYAAVTVTDAGTYSTFGLSLPISTTLAANTVQGSVTSVDAIFRGNINADTTNNRFAFQFYSDVSGVLAIKFSAQYVIA